MICKNCGAPLSPQMKYCPYCNAKVTEQVRMENTGDKTVFVGQDEATAFIEQEQGGDETVFAEKLPETGSGRDGSFFAGKADKDYSSQEWKSGPAADKKQKKDAAFRMNIPAQPVKSRAPKTSRKKAKDKKKSNRTNLILLAILLVLIVILLLKGSI